MSLNWAYKEKKIASPALKTSCCANVQSTMVDLETLHGRGAIQTNHASNVKKNECFGRIPNRNRTGNGTIGTHINIPNKIFIPTYIVPLVPWISVYFRFWILLFNLEILKSFGIYAT